MQPTTRRLAAPLPAPLPAALAGVLAAGLALGVGHLVAVATGPATSPLLTVGGVLIDSAPQALKAFAIETFGTADKVVLLGGIVAALAVIAAGLGLLAVRRPALGVLGVAAFGVVGTGAALTRPNATFDHALPAIAGAAAASVALLALVRALRPVAPAAEPVPAPRPTMLRPAAPVPARRTFLARAAGVAALAVMSGAVGTLVQARPGRSPGLRALPTVADPAPPIDPTTDLGVDGISPFIVPNADFYRVDIALVPPVVDVASWRLRIHGMVEREVALTWDDLLALPLVERTLTLACVSNQVGGPYVGNARWIGVRLADVLAEAGVEPGRGASAGADQLVSRGADGITIGTPTAIALDGRDSLLAIGMNGEPLPVEHGAPVRMIVPGLFGYVSATKWLTELELTTFNAYDTYWVQRGWAVEAPVRTMSRIDTPRPLARVPGGATVRIGGVAWAPHRGITRVEVRVDDGPWRPARLGAVDTIDTWRQWSIDWTATPGRHSLSVRAADGSGALQPEERAEPFPSGATGWHTVVVTAT